jgi:outer membrane immunogenic protein
MKKLLAGVLGVVSMATSASAADLPVKARPVAVSPAYNWSGFYIGGNVGYGFGRVDDESSSTLAATPAVPGVLPAPLAGPITIPFASSTRTAVDGVIGGGQIGYNAQFNRWVLGIEADIQASDQKRNASTFTTFGGSTPPALLSQGPLRLLRELKPRPLTHALIGSARYAGASATPPAI